MRKLTRFRYIDWPEYGRLVEELARVVASEDEDFDLVVGIARGGVPVAMAVSDRLGTKTDFINVKSYLGLGSRTKPKILATITEEIGAKRVLLVDDLIDEGDTMRTVTEYLSRKGPAVIKTAVLFKKPWSSVQPNYSLSVVGEWVVFPYERGEVKRLRSAQRGRERAASRGSQRGRGAASPARARTDVQEGRLSEHEGSNRARL
ncbi:MAG: hypothetical protein JRM86_02460 [Nitrososphaerota archaeon]|nr:hypothetical protein [Nitrososphaerota archaeon]